VARPQLRLPGNAAGPFFVDASCIDCGTCWQWDPDHFAPAGAHARVWDQPEGEAAVRRALLALQACPVAAIGAPREWLRQTPVEGFPALITRLEEGEVMYCGWASRRSFGASSYLIVRPGPGGQGRSNVLIDSPRFNAALARRLEALGGVDLLLLSHRDDVADQQAFHERFGCERWIHAGDADAVPEAEHVLEGIEPFALADDLLLIPTPGHTAGSMVGPGARWSGGLPPLLLVGLGAATAVGAAPAGPGCALAAAGPWRSPGLRPRGVACRRGRAVGAGRLSRSSGGRCVTVPSGPGVGCGVAGPGVLESHHVQPRRRFSKSSAQTGPRLFRSDRSGTA
jgi:ferredoxin